jgi:uncharacterized protein GlcG (DUF336 family)
MGGASMCLAKMNVLRLSLTALGVLWLAGCSSGSSALSSAGVSPGTPDCNGSCASAATALSVVDVQTIIAQGVAEASARHVSATIAVVDRVGNVLGVYRMGDPSTRSVQIASTLNAAGEPVIQSGLEGIKLPAPQIPGFAGANIDGLAAISKAITGAYLSSEGNAFSTRTASQIVQQHFNPGVPNQPSGPLFGVQFSQLACSDLMQRYSQTLGASVGPQRSPLGLSADPGGFPLYKGGTVVGGVGVLADGLYSVDIDVNNLSIDTDEAIALAASYGYGAPLNRRADQITAGGISLRYSNVDVSQLASNPGTAPAFASLPAAGLIGVTGYTAASGAIQPGSAFGQPSSGIRPEGGVDFPGLDAFVLVDNTNQPRYAPRAATDVPNALTRAEVVQLLASAFKVANQARAQIRRPLGSSAAVTISVVDTQGVVLGVVRTRDAPIFGTDVSLQKARSAALFSSSTAAAFVSSLPDATYVRTFGPSLATTAVPLAKYIQAAQTFDANAALFTDGQIAFTDRAIGNLARPLFPDGIDDTPNGPLSLPAGQWSVFSTGLQLDLSINAIVQHVLFTQGVVPDVAQDCTGVGLSLPPAPLAATAAALNSRLANGLQIFPGSAPIYRGDTLIGAIGVSGDGVDQDDMVAFFGLEQASQALSGAIVEAPAIRRADTLTPQGTRLRYVQCPQSPFVNSNAENVCTGL